MKVKSQHSQEDIFKSLSQFHDSSNYPPNHPLYSIKNKSKLGCFKDETAGIPIEEMILLRPKMYSIKLQNKEEVKRAKGIKRYVVQRMKHREYKKVYRKVEVMSSEMTNIQAHHHIISTHTYRKRSLGLWEDKRYWWAKNESVPYGFMNKAGEPPSKIRRIVPPSGDLSS